MSGGRLALLGGKPVREKPFQGWPVYGKAEEEALLRVLRSGRWGCTSGNEVENFEKRFAAYQGAKHGIAVVNGTAALRIALLAAGVEAGDEVIVPPFTFLATATAVVEANATPIFVDVDLETFNLDPRKIEAAITPRTRAIIPVHFGGLSADMEAILAIAWRHKLVVIEDAAHAHGAEYKGRRLGSIGDMGCFSFQSSKNLNSGEGGIITTNDAKLAKLLWSIHNCGRDPEGGAWYEHHVISANHRMTEFQAALLDAQMDRLEGQTVTRDRNGRYLAGKLKEIPGVHPQRRDSFATRHSYHVFCFRINPDVWGVPHVRVLAALQAEGIPAHAGYPLPLYKQPVFAERRFGPYTGYRAARPGIDYAKVSCPNCETLCYRQGCWIAHAALLGEQADMEDIAAAFVKVYEQRGELA